MSKRPNASSVDGVFIAKYNCDSVISVADAKPPLVFTEKITKTVTDVMKSTTRNKARARSLKELFEDSGIISVDSTFEEVNGNAPLQRLIRSTLGMGLSKVMEGSVFSNVVPDFDLFFNCSTDAKLNQFLSSKAIVITYPEMVILQGQAKKLSALVSRTRKNLLEDMELSGTPDRSNHKKQKTAHEVEVQMKEDAAKCKKANDMSNKNEGDDKNKDKEDEMEGDDDEEGITEFSLSSSSSSSSVKTISKKVVERVVEFFPELKDGHYLELIDGMLKLVVAEC